MVCAGKANQVVELVERCLAGAGWSSVTSGGGSLSQGWLKGKRFVLSAKLNDHLNVARANPLHLNFYN